MSTRLSLITRSRFADLSIGRPCLFAAEGDEDDPTDLEQNENEEDPDGGAGGSEKDKRDPQKKITAQQEEINRHFQARKAAEEERDQLKAWKEEQERKGKTELENIQADLEKATKRNQELESTVQKLVLKNAFLSSKDYEWHNPERALALVDLSAVQINEDGSVKNPDVLAAAIKKLADEEPYMLKQKSEDGAGDDKPKIPTGTKPVKPAPKSDAAAERKRLLSKYPALRNH